MNTSTSQRIIKGQSLNIGDCIKTIEDSADFLNLQCKRERGICMTSVTPKEPRNLTLHTQDRLDLDFGPVKTLPDLSAGTFESGLYETFLRTANRDDFGVRRKHNLQRSQDRTNLQSRQDRSRYETLSDHLEENLHSKSHMHSRMTSAKKQIAMPSHFESPSNITGLTVYSLSNAKERMMNLPARSLRSTQANYFSNRKLSPSKTDSQKSIYKNLKTIFDREFQEDFRVSKKGEKIRMKKKEEGDSKPQVKFSEKSYQKSSAAGAPVVRKVNTEVDLERFSAYRKAQLNNQNIRLPDLLVLDKEYKLLEHL